MCVCVRAFHVPCHGYGSHTSLPDWVCVIMRKYGAGEAVRARSIGTESTANFKGPGAEHAYENMHTHKRRLYSNPNLAFGLNFSIKDVKPTARVCVLEMFSLCA